MTIDIERTQGLLDIVESCAKHSGKLTSISNEAMSELLTMNEVLRTEAIDRHRASQAQLRPATTAPIEPEPESTDDTPPTTHSTARRL